MASNKSWIQIRNRLSDEYKVGMEEFLNYAFECSTESDKILCPCIKCRNHKYLNKKDVRLHLLKHDIIRDYTTWTFHGETSNVICWCQRKDALDTFQSDDMTGLVNDTWTIAKMVESIRTEGIDERIVPYKPIAWGYKAIFLYFLPTHLHEIFI